MRRPRRNDRRIDERRSRRNDERRSHPRQRRERKFVRASLTGERDDRATRERVLEAARRLFVERGFRKVSVREITDEAGANIAAVSYHFGDKFALYTEVLREAIALARDAFEATRADAGGSPEERLRQYMRASMQRLANADERRQWMQQLMRHEMTDPTPGLSMLIKQASLPRMRYLADIASELLGRPASDPVVGLCVASIHAQFVFQAKSQFRDLMFGEWRINSIAPEQVADSIVEFTLGGLAAMRGAGMKGSTPKR